MCSTSAVVGFPSLLVTDYACAVSSDRYTPRIWHLVPAFVAFSIEPLRMRLLLGEAVCTEIESGAPLGTYGGVGPVRYPVRAHTPGESQHFCHRLPHQGLGTVASQHALPERIGVECPAVAGEQVLAGAFGRLELGVADTESLRAGLREYSVTVGVGIARHTVSAYAVGVADR